MAAFEVAQALGFDIVPPTRRVHTEWGPASLQKEVIYDDLLRWEHQPRYHHQDRQMNAAFDYILANGDRSLDNLGRTLSPHLSGVGGISRIAAIDNDMTFPVGTEKFQFIRSDFLAEERLRILDPRITESIARLDRSTLTSTLLDLDIGQAQIDAMYRRMDEIMARGQVTGESWGGVIANADDRFNNPEPVTMTRPPYSTWLGADRTLPPRSTWPD